MTALTVKEQFFLEWICVIVIGLKNSRYVRLNQSNAKPNLSAHIPTLSVGYVHWVCILIG